jgi:Trk K+ transport system NAD-binding subunit
MALLKAPVSRPLTFWSAMLAVQGPLISVAREGRSEIATGSTKLEAGDRVLAILQPGCEDELRRVLLKH